MTTSEEQFHEELVAMVSQGQRDDGSATRTTDFDGFRWGFPWGFHRDFLIEIGINIGL